MYDQFIVSFRIFQYFIFVFKNGWVIVFSIHAKETVNNRTFLFIKLYNFHVTLAS